MPISPRRRLLRVVAGALPLALASGVLVHALSSSNDAEASARAAAPSFLTPAPTVDTKALVRPQVDGRRRLVGLRPSLLPRVASGQRLSFPLFSGTTLTGIVDRVSTGPGYTAWTGRLTTPLGDFSIVRAGDDYRVDVSSLQGDYEVTPAGGDAYWVSRSAPPTMRTHDDVVQPPAATSAARTARSGGLVPRRLHDSGRELDVLFAYNSQLVQQAGSVAAIRAYAGSIVAQTNQALSQSGDPKVKLRMVGLFHTSTDRAHDFARNLTWLRKPHDGHYDGVVQQRNKVHADVVHLLLPGTDAQYCGLGYEPPNPRDARPIYGYSMSIFADCSLNHSGTHELGHNMGADHDRYPGVQHNSLLKYAAGKVNTDLGWVSIMAYPNHVLDVNPSACCTYLLYYTNPAVTYNGTTVGGTRQFNAKAIAEVEPQVARYELGTIQHVGLRITGRPRVGRYLRVTHGLWAPRRHTRVTYRWYLDGKRLPDRHPRILVKRNFRGHHLAVHVTGHHKTYDSVTVVLKPSHSIH